MQKKNVAVIGIGRVGLPLALVFANEGYTVYGIGRDQLKIQSIEKGIMPFIEEGAEKLLKKYVNKDFFPTTDVSVVEKCQYIVLTLGTPIDENSAELAKFFTNMYRYIDFAIANEFMILSENYNRDIYEIIKLVNHNYKRGGIKIPGFTGGPCLFKDGFFLISDLPYMDLISTSWKINESLPLVLVKKIRERTRLDGKKVALLGLAFKAEIDDIRESLSFKVRKALLRERALVTLHDPFVKDYKDQAIEKDIYKAIEGADVIFIATNHKYYQHLDVRKIKRLVKKNTIICDVWNVFKTDKIVFTINHLANGKKAK